jgi:hippurate hydrolase
MTTAQLITWRHSLHEIAETAFNEHKTAEYIAEQLRLLGLEVTTGIGGTGVIGTLTRGSGKKTIGLRADLDGLPLLEKSAVSYKSKYDGAMHAF